MHPSWRMWSLAMMSALCVATVHAEEIRLAVAANFSSAMDELVKRFEATSPHIVLVSVGSTGGHYAQIRNGAPFDAFFAADTRRPQLLEEAGIAVAGSRFTYAVGQIALWSPQADFVDAAGRILESQRFRHLAIANPELAPYGAAAREVLEHRGLWMALQDRLVKGQDIGQTYSFVYSGNAEIGFVAYSQLRRPGQTIPGSYWLVPQTLYGRIEQQAVLLKERPAARSFLAFVKTREAREIILAYGYGL
jgi:molybdate transport system substrate-binding protein